MRLLAVTNIYPTPRRPALGTFVEQQLTSLSHLGIDVDVLFVDRAHLGMQSYLGLGRRVRDRVATTQPDLVHIMYGGIMAAVVTRAVTDRPMIVSFCGSDLYGELLSGRLRKVISRCGVLASHLAAKRAQGVIVKSKLLQDELPRTINRSKVRIIPNGVDLERFQPLDRESCRQRLEWDSQRFHVLFPTNSGDPRKRLFLAKAAVERLSNLDVPVELHELRGVPHHEVGYWLNASDVVLLTSTHEGSPNVIKEALACDVPIVSVDVGDVYERISDLRGCYLADPDPDDLCAKLKQVHAGPRRIAGRDKVQNLSLQRTALRLQEFYCDILKSQTKVHWAQDTEAASSQ